MALVGNVHLVEGTESDVPLVLALLEQEGVHTSGNPDLYVRSYGLFGVDEAREIRDKASLGAIGDRRIFVLSTANMTNEAQNALLKTLEEPAGQALFFLIVPAPQMLLSTLRSRAQMLTMDTAGPVILVDPKKFIAAQPSVRLEMLKPLLEKDEDDKRDMGAVITFLSSLERMLEGRANKVDGREGIDAVYRARKYAGDRGSLLKPLLEQVALLI